MEKQRVTSTMTLWSKFLLTSSLVLQGGIEALRICLGNLPSENFAYVGLALVIAALSFFTSRRLKIVWLDNEVIYISNYVRMIAIPASEVARVSQSKIPGTPYITVHFKDSTIFGRSITFDPDEQGFAPTRTCRKLREMAGLPQFDG